MEDCYQIATATASSIPLERLHNIAGIFTDQLQNKTRPQLLEAQLCKLWDMHFFIN